MRLVKLLLAIFVVVFLATCSGLVFYNKVLNASGSGTAQRINTDQGSSGGSGVVYQSTALGGVTTTPLPRPAPPTPTPAPRQAAVGVYTLNRKLSGQNNWMDGTITTIEVRPDETLKLTAVFRNNRASSAEAMCFDWANVYLLLDDGTRIAPTSTFCDGQEDAWIGADPGQQVTTWFVFPPLTDASQPFSIQWIYVNGFGGGDTIKDILLQ